MITVLFLLFPGLVTSKGNLSALYREDDICMRGNGDVCLRSETCTSLERLTETERQLYMRGCSDKHNTSLICCPNPMIDGIQTDPSTMLPSPPHCGKTIHDAAVDDRIVGGEDARPGAWPWTVALGTRLTTGRVSFFCGGALITSLWVLSAAHCFYVQSLPLNWARLGARNLADDDGNGRDVEIANVVPHENYSRQKLYFDIGLIKLKRQVQFTPFIRPVCLPTGGAVSTSQYEDEYPFVVGWGTTSNGGSRSDVLQQVQISVVNRQMCRGIYLHRTVRIVNSQICAGSLHGDRDSCQGDSGGPLVMFETTRNSYYIIGIVSFGYRCATPGYPGVYTKVSSYIDWINETVQKI